MTNMWCVGCGRMYEVGDTRCRTCGRSEVRIDASAAVPKGKRNWGLLIISAAAILTLILSRSSPDRSPTTMQKQDEVSRTLALYGQPDRDESTEYDSPRPPIVTRFIEYRAAGVKIAFVPIAKYGEAPPYAAWKIFGYIDMASNTKMSRSEAEERLRARR